jgi:hypothetical protein
MTANRRARSWLRVKSLGAERSRGAMKFPGLAGPTQARRQLRASLSTPHFRAAFTDRRSARSKRMAPAPETVRPQSIAGCVVIVQLSVPGAVNSTGAKPVARCLGSLPREERETPQRAAGGAVRGALTAFLALQPLLRVLILTDGRLSAFTNHGACLALRCGGLWCHQSSSTSSNSAAMEGWPWARAVSTPRA